MASFGEVTYSKRPHVKTERMQEFIRSQGEANSPTKKLKCPEACCNKVFTSSPGLKYHLQTHAVKDPQFSCKKCHKVFKSANGLKYHREKTKCDDSDILSSSLYTANLTQELGIQDLPEMPNHTLTATTTTTHLLSKPMPYRLDLSLGPSSVGMDKLTEFAQIATSPQSPLMQKPKPPWDNKPSAAVRCLEQMLAADRVEEMTALTEPEISTPHRLTATTADTTAVLQDGDRAAVYHDGSDPRVSTSSPLCVSPAEEEGSYTSTWSHSWPTPVWQCFISGTRVRFIESSLQDGVWQLADHIGHKEDLAMQAAHENARAQIPRYAEEGLCVKNIVQTGAELDQSEVELHFSPGLVGQSDCRAVCQRDHPFFVKDKGWSSIYPLETVQHYGIPCCELDVGDVCLAPSHTDAAAFSEEMFDFTAEDTSAALALSSMKQRKDSDLSPQAGSVQQKPPTRFDLEDSPTKAKRPMNAFLLFAKDFRLGYTQKFPKRDNRAISVILGEHWKQLSAEKKQKYEERAKLLADRQKKMHPDCWKRKK